MGVRGSRSAAQRGPEASAYVPVNFAALPCRRRRSGGAMDRRKRLLIYAVMALCTGAAVFVTDPSLSWTAADTSVGKCGYYINSAGIRSRAIAGIGRAIRSALPER